MTFNTWRAHGGGGEVVKVLAAMHVFNACNITCTAKDLEEGSMGGTHVMYTSCLMYKPS